MISQSIAVAASPSNLRHTRHLLNLGCGSRYRAEWTNVDVISTGPGVIAHDLRRGLPFNDGEFGVVYHSHVLEHFSRGSALRFVSECFRVLEAGGVIRVVVPDLERIATLYLAALEQAQRDESFAERYRWMMLEMYDQVVREFSGGDMALQLQKASPTLREFVLERLGSEARNLLPIPASRDDGAPVSTLAEAHPQLVVQPVPAARAKHVRGKPLFRQIAGLIRHPSRLRERFIQSVLGNEYALLKLGRFRNSGEIHQWMYDRYSLGKLLTDAGFVNPTVCGPADSQIAGWSAFHLDTEVDGTTYKPDSLYMEALKR